MNRAEGKCEKEPTRNFNVTSAHVHPLNWLVDMSQFSVNKAHDSQGFSEKKNMTLRRIFNNCFGWHRWARTLLALPLGALWACFQQWWLKGACGWYGRTQILPSTLRSLSCGGGGSSSSSKQELYFVKENNEIFCKGKPKTEQCVPCNFIRRSAILIFSPVGEFQSRNVPCSSLLITKLFVFFRSLVRFP